MVRIAILAAVLSSGCLRANSEFHCTSNSDCTNGGAAGRCEPVGFCSYADATCASGQRFGEAAGALTSTCVGGGEPLDAGVDTKSDAPSPVVPMLVAEAHTNQDIAAQLTYSLGIPSSSNLFLLVSVQIANDSCNPNPPNVTGVTFDGIALDRITTILGVGCSAQSTRSEQWGLVAPHSGGAHDVVVTLDGAGDSVHTGAMGFSGVDPASPVRASVAGANVVEATSSTIDVPSQVGDLVVNTIGQGGNISGPVLPATLIFLNDVDGHDTLNNSGASYLAGQAGMTTMAWTFSSPDEYQTISSSLEPAP
jgi:hypothetical protein